MQRAYGCDRILVHDEDLEGIDGIGEGTVSGHSIISSIVLYVFAVTRIPPTRSIDGSSPEVERRDI
jgi:hypothetical protein